MSSFQATLDDEIVKREKSGKKPTRKKSNNKNTNVNDKWFYGSSFLNALAVCAVILIMFIAYLLMTQGDFYAELQARVASKAVIIQDSSKPANQITLNMPPATNVGEATPVVYSDAGSVLQPSPINGFYNKTVDGLLPKRNGALTPFDAYKRPFNSNNKSTLSIIITDLGINAQRTKELIDTLPADVTLSFSPYGNNLKKLTDYARSRGHEVWLTLPMETKNYPIDDPGPLTLFINSSMEKNDKRLAEVMASTDGYVGFITSKGHKFSAEDGDIKPAFQNVFERGLAIIDSNPYSRNFVSSIAGSNDYPHGQNNVWVDEALGEQNAYLGFRRAIDIAVGRDHATIMIRPYPSSIKALKTFLNSSQAQQFQLAPASATVKYE